MLADDALGQQRRGLVLADVAGLEARRDDFAKPLAAHRRDIGGGNDVSLLHPRLADFHGVGRDGALGEIEGDGSEFHAAGLSERKGFLRNDATISPAMAVRATHARAFTALRSMMPLVGKLSISRLAATTPRASAFKRLPR